MPLSICSHMSDRDLFRDLLDSSIESLIGRENMADRGELLTESYCTVCGPDAETHPIDAPSGAMSGRAE